MLGDGADIARAVPLFLEPGNYTIGQNLSHRHGIPAAVCRSNAQVGDSPYCGKSLLSITTGCLG